MPPDSVQQRDNANISAANTRATGESNNNAQPIEPKSVGLELLRSNASTADRLTSAQTPLEQLRDQPSDHLHTDQINSSAELAADNNLGIVGAAALGSQLPHATNVINLSLIHI